jgi:threonylcarbamoyladenosine tRNA methylthiotransferase CDKAL1
MKAYVSCVGCEQRELDSQRVINYLKKNELDITNNPANADYLFIVTCGVDLNSQKTSLQSIQTINNQMSASAKLIIGGCLPDINPLSLKQFNVYHTFSPQTIDTLDKVLNFPISISDIDFPNTSVFDTQNTLTNQTSRERFEQAKNGYKVVIADGCLGECSYCAIKEATGKLNSRPLETLVTQFKIGIENQEPTIMLMAGDTGSYGRDINSDFHSLLKEITSIKGNSQIYIHDFGVNWLIRDISKFLQIFDSAEERKLFGGITFPIQSGSNRILRRMRRQYEISQTIDALNQLGKYSFDIGTHIMVGFPGETEQDFNETISLLDQVKFDFITCFPYSETPVAESASLDKKVDLETVKRRIEKLQTIFQEKIKVIM